jgi:hypothetical protein
MTYSISLVWTRPSPSKLPWAQMVILILIWVVSQLIKKVYHYIIGSLLYLYVSRPDIMLSVYMCKRFQATPKEYHLRAVKRIMRYLVLTLYLSLWYPKGVHFELIGYSNVDYAGCKVDRKSTSGTCQFLGRSLVCWSSKKQNYVALSTAEAK